MIVWTTLALVNALDVCERGLDARDTLAAKLGVGPNDHVDILTILNELGLSDALFCMGAPGNACKAEADRVLGAMVLEVLNAPVMYDFTPSNAVYGRLCGAWGLGSALVAAESLIDKRSTGHMREAKALEVMANLRSAMDDTEAPDVRCWIELHWTLLDPTVTLSTALVRAVACLNDLAAMHGRQRRVLYDLTGRLRAHLTENA